ncbi:MAG: hypothetical protein GY943_04305 [Chloroflexi bacterium]|nr:hypothetical protein [Chloroflexota bacterium]
MSHQHTSLYLERDCPVSSGTFVGETAVCINNQQSTINEQLQTAVSPHSLIPKIRCTLTTKRPFPNPLIEICWEYGRLSFNHPIVPHGRSHHTASALQQPIHQQQYVRGQSIRLMIRLTLDLTLASKIPFYIL